MIKAVRIIFILVLASICFKGSAQMWGYPNSEWYYSKNWMSGSGYKKATFTGTATINNKICQKLDFVEWTYSYQGSVTSSIISTYYTYELDSVVFLYMIKYNTFDTLYNFKANIGDKWLLPRHYWSNFNCNRYQIQVVDTGHSVIQGQKLKWLKLNGANSIDTLYQRIGMYYHFAFDYISHCANADYIIGGPLRCYSDQQISNYKKYSGDCDYFYNPNSIKEFDRENFVGLYPSPSTDKVTLELSSDYYKSLEVFNSNGQLILSEKINNPIISINIANFNSGLYFIVLNSKSGDKLLKKFVRS